MHVKDYNSHTLVKEMHIKRAENGGNWQLAYLQLLYSYCIVYIGTHEINVNVTLPN